MPDTSNAIKFAPVLDPTPEEIERISNAASSVCDGIRQYDQAMGGKTFRELPAAGQPLAPFLTLLLNVDALVIAIEEANKFDAEPSYPPDDFEVCGWPRVEDVRETLYEIWQALEALESVFRPVVPSFISGDGRYTLYRFWNVASARGKKLVGWWYPADEAERLVIHGYGTIEEPRSSLALDAIEDAMKYECTAQRLQELVNSSNYLGTVNPELALRIEARQSANEPPRDLPADYVTEDVELDPDRTWPRCSDWEGVFAGDAEMLEAYDGNELAGTFASLADQLREQTVDTERMLDAELVAAGFEPVGHDKRKRHRLCLAIGFPPDQMTDVERLRDHVAAWTIRQKAASAASRNTDQAGYSDVGSRPAMRRGLAAGHGGGHHRGREDDSTVSSRYPGRGWAPLAGGRQQGTSADQGDWGQTTDASEGRRGHSWRTPGRIDPRSHTTRMGVRAEDVPTQLRREDVSQRQGYYVSTHGCSGHESRVA